MAAPHSNARELAIQTAQNILKETPIFLDTETTGLGKDAEVIELAVVDDEGKVLMDQMFRPANPIPPGATKIHHITNKMVAKKPVWGIYWPTIRGILFGKTICMYNADYDLRLIFQSNSHYGIRRERLNGFCVMKLYAQFRSEWDRQHNHYKWFRLEQAGADAKIPLSNAHRAVDDTLLTRALLHWIAEQDA